MASKKATKGTIPRSEDFTPLATIEGQPGIGDVMVGEDLRLYRETHGLLEMIVPCDPREDTEPGLWYKTLNRDDCPPIEELAYLYDTFLSKYDREVMFVVGKLYGKPGYLYMVTAQEGTVGSIRWDDVEGMEWFAARARFLGTVHVHPGNGCNPSGTDLEHWKEKECSGIHLIFGRNQDFTMHASVAGHVIYCDQGSIEGIERTKVTLETGLDRKLVDLLKQPPPMPHFDFDFQTMFDGKGKRGRRGRRGRKKRDDERLFNWDDWLKDQKEYERRLLAREMNPIGEALLDSNAVCVKMTEEGSVAGLRVVSHDGFAWIMSEWQYEQYCKEAAYAQDGKWPTGSPLAFELS